MANRVISVETKVKVMQECLRLVNVEEVAARHGVSARAIYGWYTEKIPPALTDVWVNRTPGSAPAPQATPVAPAPTTARPTVCPACGETWIWKNGTYAVINWVWLLTVGWLIGLQRVPIQRWRCAAVALNWPTPNAHASGQPVRRGGSRCAA
jgi:hypothetical protein